MHKLPNILVKETSVMEILHTSFCLLIDLWGFYELITICKNIIIIQVRDGNNTKNHSIYSQSKIILLEDTSDAYHLLI